MYNRILKDTNFKIALTVHLPSWKTSLKQIKTQNLTICVTNKIFNLNIGYGNEKIKFVITTTFIGVQIDNNLT